MPAVVLATLNARFIHASLGLRYLYANMGDLQSSTVLREFTLDQRPIDIVESLLAEHPRIVGLGVYIWNVELTASVVALLKEISPEVVVVLGGPEVSFEHVGRDIIERADYIICGAADLAFERLCRQVLAGSLPTSKVIPAETVSLAAIASPYTYFTDDDLRHRLTYVEASRGCPFKCEFCLSALDKTAWPFDLDRFLADMDDLHRRGARHFKFVDRTFNLNIKTSIRIMEFFLARMDETLFVHFELVPDHLPDALKEVITRFPPGQLQFEIGIQSFNPDVQHKISRRQDNEKSEQNLRWLREHTHAHLHADLIFGLPGEDLESFGRGFNRLVALNPHEIQVGILKRLRGTPIIRHTGDYAMRYNPQPPYNILATRHVDFAATQRMQRFARYWDMIANSGRFTRTMPLLLGDNAFARFSALSDEIWRLTGQTHRIAMERLFTLVLSCAPGLLGIDQNTLREVLHQDFAATGALHIPNALIGVTPSAPRAPGNTRARQVRHARPN